jgi:hypothetical protein
MKKLEISDLIGTLSAEEFKKLGCFINSPYFGISKRVAALYDHLSQNYDSALSGNLSREEAARSVLGNSFSGDNARRLFSDMNHVIEEFLSAEAFASDPAEKQLLLLKTLRKREDIQRFSLKIKELKKQIQLMKPDIPEYRIALEASEEEFHAEDAADFYEYSPSLQQWSDKLDSYYMSSKLLIFEYMYSKHLLNNNGKAYRWNMADEIFSNIEANIELVKQETPDVYLKYLMVKMVREKNDDLIIDYAEFLRANEEKFSRENASSLYSDLYNYTTIRISRGKHEFRRPLLELIKQIDQKGLLYDSGKEKMHIYTFKQIADTAFYLKEIVWVEDFINRYKNKLSAGSTSNVLSLVKSKLLYYKGDIDAARLELAKVNYDDYMLYLDAKSFQLCLEYDDDNFNECVLILDSLNKYLRSTKEIPESSTVNAKRFIYYLRKLMSYKEGTKDEFYLLKLAEEINGEDNPVYCRKWINDKIEELNTA